MSSKRKLANVSVHGLIAKSNNPNGREILRFLNPPTKLAVTTNAAGQLVCTKTEDSYDNFRMPFVVFPAAEVPEIRQKADHRESQIRIGVSERYSKSDWPPFDKDYFCHNELAFVRDYEFGIITCTPGINRFVELLIALLRLCPDFTMLITSTKKQLLKQLKSSLDRSGHSLPLVTGEDPMPSGVRVLFMTGESFYKRPGYLSAAHEASISGIEPYDLVFVLDPHDWLGPTHDSRSRVAMMSSYCRAMFGVILNHGKRINNELAILRKYFGYADLSIQAKYQRPIIVWSLAYQSNSSINLKDLGKSFANAITNNKSRNRLIVRIAHEFVTNRWPFDRHNERFQLSGTELIIVTLNASQKALLRNELLSYGYATTAIGWSRFRERYVKIYTRSEFRQLREYRGNLIIDADGRGQSLCIHSDLVNRSFAVSAELNVVEFTDFFEQKNRRWKKSYAHAARVTHVRIRRGGVTRRGAR